MIIWMAQIYINSPWHRQTAISADFTLVFSCVYMVGLYVFFKMVCHIMFKNFNIFNYKCVIDYVIKCSKIIGILSYW